MHNWCEKTARNAKKTAKTIINMKIYEEVLRKTNSGLEIFIYYWERNVLIRNLRVRFEVMTSDRLAICMRIRIKMVRQPTICKILETVDVAETVLKSQQKF